MTGKSVPRASTQSGSLTADPREQHTFPDRTGTFSSSSVGQRIGCRRRQLLTVSSFEHVRHNLKLRRVGTARCQCSSHGLWPSFRGGGSEEFCVGQAGVAPRGSITRLLQRPQAPSRSAAAWLPVSATVSLQRCAENSILLCGSCLPNAVQADTLRCSRGRSGWARGSQAAGLQVSGLRAFMSPTPRRLMAWLDHLLAEWTQPLPRLCDCAPPMSRSRHGDNVSTHGCARASLSVFTKHDVSKRAHERLAMVQHQSSRADWYVRAFTDKSVLEIDLRS
jgi:hypothetical protein